MERQRIYMEIALISPSSMEIQFKSNQLQTLLKWCWNYYFIASGYQSNLWSGVVCTAAAAAIATDNDQSVCFTSIQSITSIQLQLNALQLSQTSDSAVAWIAL